MRFTLTTLLCVSCLQTANSFAEDNYSHMRRQKQTEYRPYRSPFRYAIISNEIVNVTSDSENAFRYIVVLLDEKSFSKDTLKELFKLVSKRFPTPNRLDVQVYTSLEQVETPEESELGKESELPSDPTSDKYHRAIFIRSRNGDELFRYSLSTPVRYLKTVILKGTDPHEPRR